LESQAVWITSLVKILVSQDGSCSVHRGKQGGRWGVEEEAAQQLESFPPYDLQCKPLASGGTRYLVL